MAFWKRSKDGITDEQRLTVLDLAVDEDFSLHEVVQRFPDIGTAKAVVEDLQNRKMVEFFWKRPKGHREEIAPAEIAAVLEGEAEWSRPKSFEQQYVIVVANDKGWRWHQSHWKSSSRA
jgi:hypothetical protein